MATATSDSDSGDGSPSTESQRAFLRRVLASNPLFSSVDDPVHREQLVRSFHREDFTRDDLLVRYGAPGDKFYILEKGEAAVEVPDTTPTKVESAQSQRQLSAAFDAAAIAATVADGAPQIVSSAVTDEFVRVDLIESGSSFGEVSLLYSIPRSANVRCLTPQCTVWSVDARTFREHSKRGSRKLKDIFNQFASVHVEGAAAAAATAAHHHAAQERRKLKKMQRQTERSNRSPNPSAAATTAATTAITYEQAKAMEKEEVDNDDDLDDEGETEERYMNQDDFVQAIEHSKDVTVWSENGEDSPSSAVQPKEQAPFFQRMAAKLLGGSPSSKKKQSSANPYANLTPHRLRLIFRLADSSGDSLLSFAEFLILHSLLAQPHSELQLAFRLFDTNKNGSIERSEFITAIRALAQDRGEKIDFQNDPLVKELFGEPVRRLRTDVERAAAHAAQEQQIHKDSAALIAEANERESRGSVRAVWKSVRTKVRGSIFHEPGTLVNPTAESPPTPSSPESGAMPQLPGKEILSSAAVAAASGSGSNGDDDDDRYVYEYKSLGYEQFASLLKRQVLPKYLKEVQQDLRAIDRYWSGGDAPFSLSVMEDGFGSSLNLEQLTSSDNLPQVATAHIADSERALVRLPWKNLLAGGIAGAVSRSIVAPIERLKMLFQMQSNAQSKTEGGAVGTSSSRRYTGLKQGLKTIYAEDGARGFFRGNLSNILRIVPVVALQFFFYDVYKRSLFGRWTDEESLTQRLGAGAAAGVTACVLTYPLDTVRARLTLQRSGTKGGYTSIRHSFQSIYRTEGMKGFYHGLVPSMVGVIPYVGLDFGVYETLKRSLPRDEHDECSRVHLFCCGALAGVVGQTIAYPLDLVRRRMQVYGWAGSGDANFTYNYHRGTFIDALRIIKYEEGYRGLYRGIGMNYLKVVPAVSIAFMVYEKVIAQLDRVH